MFIKVLVKTSRFTIVGKLILPPLSCTQNNVSEVDQDPRMWGGIDHQERNKYKFPGVCPGGGIMHNHITPGVGVEVL